MTTATKRCTKSNAAQPSLWQEEPVYHQLIEVHYQGGREEIYCTAKPYRPVGEGQIYAGYVGFPIEAKDCPLCSTQEKGSKQCPASR